MSAHPRARRPHRKSRAGCRNCKQRRVKCDELKPTCGNCSRFAIPCDFSPNLAGSQQSDDLLNNTLTQRKRGRPRKDWSAITGHFGPHEEIYERSETTAPSLDPLSIKGSTSSPHWTVDELELLHHYLTDGQLSQGDKLLWQIKVPRLAFTHHCALHLILAVSAFHLMRLEPDRSEHFRRLAGVHHSIGIRQATDLFPRLSKDNCSALYVASALACACGFARGTTPGNLLVVAEGCEVPWLDLLRGVRIIIENIGLEHVFSGVLGPFPPPQPEKPSRKEAYRVEFVPWEEPLQKLSTLISAAPVLSRGIYNNTLGCLSWCFHETYGTSAAPKNEIIGQFQVIIAWLYKLDECFVGFLREKQPPALIILAHFAILLSSLEYCWFLEGWANHVSQGIADSLDPSYEQWLQWPSEQIDKSIKSRRNLEKFAEY
ncbi:hypothetical protein F5Y00DRAFT_269255 [Daldinia vernicosa]|uniref:uncharacterized protein n=1 Tax=Daldinia vernicosa TaxID=114800 RepID=UPI00200829CC|nr:uncharacterized protein F5Y00DRAFT_269255 [Daldinia vernicosa]KAI0853909.1 hypothetical protein F5Y00DRAFT_269255 [Daldinia vernicosa]